MTQGRDRDRHRDGQRSTDASARHPGVQEAVVSRGAFPVTSLESELRLQGASSRGSQGMA